MKTAIKFVLAYFTVSIAFLVLAYLTFPKAYPGDSFIIVSLYALNLITGLIVFPIFYLMIKKKPLKQRAGYIIYYFFAIIIIINILPLVTEHIFYSLNVVFAMFKPTEMQMANVVEFINPVASFMLTYWLFRKSKLWTAELDETVYIK